MARVLRQVASAATARRGERRVSPGELAIVEDIAHNGGTTVGEVAERTGLAQSLVSTTVATMSDAGVLEATRDPADGRKLRLSIHPAMRAKFKARGRKPIEPSLRQALPDLSDKEIREVEDLLDRLAALVVRRDG
jgi:DNA-binding MarR family transcriptional regulator